jgi:2-phospho-L-lactate/phosphoenolpyruvate guanylyltransferase
MSTHDDPSPVIAIVPVGTLDGAKSRLGAVLDAEERHELAASLARRTIAAAVDAPSIAEVLVITPDDEVRGLALDLGARPIRQRSTGLNVGLREARGEAVAAGAAAIIILPTDLPDVDATAIEAVLAPLHDDPRRPLVVIVPDRHGRGTNALVVAPPDAIDVRFGGDSRAAHAAAAGEAGARLVELGGPLRLDLDTPDDLVLAQTDDPELARG